MNISSFSLTADACASFFFVARGFYCGCLMAVALLGMRLYGCGLEMGPTAGFFLGRG